MTGISSTGETDDPYQPVTTHRSDRRYDVLRVKSPYAVGQDTHHRGNLELKGETMETIDKLLENIDDVIKKLTWKTQNGHKLHIWEMDTDHVYNSMKMIYNHLANGCGAVTVKPFHNMYFEANSLKSIDRRVLLRKAMAFNVVIERRGDLPYENDGGYDIISKALRNPYVVMRLLSGRRD
jgi:hypothetical protein